MKLPRDRKRVPNERLLRNLGVLACLLGAVYHHVLGCLVAQQGRSDRGTRYEWHHRSSLSPLASASAPCARQAPATPLARFGGHEHMGFGHRWTHPNDCLLPLPPAAGSKAALSPLRVLRRPTPRFPQGWAATLENFVASGDRVWGHVLPATRWPATPPVGSPDFKTIRSERAGGFFSSKSNGIERRSWPGSAAGTRIDRAG